MFFFFLFIVSSFLRLDICTNSLFLDFLLTELQASRILGVYDLFGLLLLLVSWLLIIDVYVLGS